MNEAMPPALSRSAVSGGRGGVFLCGQAYRDEVVTSAKGQRAATNTTALELFYRPQSTRVVVVLYSRASLLGFRDGLLGGDSAPDGSKRPGLFFFWCFPESSIMPGLFQCQLLFFQGHPTGRQETATAAAKPYRLSV